jgi:hypothetical protein
MGKWIIYKHPEISELEARARALSSFTILEVKDMQVLDSQFLSKGTVVAVGDEFKNPESSEYERPVFYWVPQPIVALGNI